MENRLNDDLEPISSDESDSESDYWAWQRT